LFDQLFAVRQHQHWAPRQARQLSEDHGLTGAGGEANHQAPFACAAGSQHGGDGFFLIGTQAGHEAGSDDNPNGACVGVSRSAINARCPI
jgi:hypothetical protein